MRVTIMKLERDVDSGRGSLKNGAPQASCMPRTESVSRDSEKSSAKFDPRLGVPSHADLTFRYDEGVFGPQPEFRRLDNIRRSLRDPSCDGPDPVYSIVMDVGRREHNNELARRMLLFGVVVYAAGQL